MEPPTPMHPVNSGTPTDNLFTQIGVRPILNARGTFTIISGSQSLPEVKQAMFEASHYYVQMDEMMAAVGAEIASHMGAPSAIVTTGCEAAIAAATVACICGTDPERSQAMPYTKTRNQVIIPKYSRNPYDFGIRMSGPEIVEVETDEEFRSKLGEHVAMIYVLSGPRAFQEPLSIKTVCAIAKEKNIPVFVDAAAEEPIVPNIHLAAGATFVGYSGGKCMRGPQAAGVLLGPKDLCYAAFWNSAPHHNWGRALKVGKEEAMGMLAAVRQWYKRDHDAEQKQWLEWDNYIADAVKDIPSVTTEVKMPDADLSNRAPTLAINWDASKSGHHRNRACGEARQGHSAHPGRRWTRQPPGQDGFLTWHHALHDAAGRLQNCRRDDFKIHAQPRPLRESAGIHRHHGEPCRHLERQASNTSAAWASSSSSCSRTEPNFPESRKGEIFQATFEGKVDANHVTLTSTMPANGYEVHFVFTGVVTGNQFTGDVKLGEYGAATFTATKA